VASAGGIDRVQAKGAADRIRSRASSLKTGSFNWDVLKADRDEGRALSLVLDSFRNSRLGFTLLKPLERSPMCWPEFIESGAWSPGLLAVGKLATFSKWACEKGGRTRLFRDAALADLALLPISVDPETDRHAWVRR